MGFKEDTKRFNAVTENSIVCKCGHSIHMIKQELVCNFCGRTVRTKKYDKEVFVNELYKALLKQEKEDE